MKKIVSVAFVFISLWVNAQDSKLWTGYFSYNAIKDVSNSSTQVFGAAQNAYFKKDINSSDITKVSTIDGLSGQDITQILHSETYHKTIIGHADGLIIIVNDIDGSMLNVVDILNKATVPPDKKGINHFMEYQGKIYISTDFGVCVYNLSNMEFGDTYYLGPNGANIEVYQSTVFNNEIYVTANNYGILKASISNPNLIDFNQWTMVASGNWLFVESTSTKIITQSTNGFLYSSTGGGFQVEFFLPDISKDARYVGGNIIFTLPQVVKVFDNQLNPIATINNTNGEFGSFSCATQINNKVYIGTTLKGLQEVNLSNTTVFNSNSPDGPDRNRVFGVKAFSNGIWTVFGDYSVSYNPYGLDSYGVSKFQTNQGWKTIDYTQLFDAKSISRAFVNPKNEKEVYLSSYYSGLLKVDDDVPTQIYNASNSSMVTIPGQVPDDLRVGEIAQDKNGNIWLTNSLVNSPLHVRKASGQWQSYTLPCVQNIGSNSYKGLIIDKNGTKWIASNHSGIIGFNESNNKCTVITEEQGHGNLPSQSVTAMAIDNKNKLWIGTESGLRVLSSVDSFLNQSNLETSSIIILEDGVAQELLFNQFITDIIVDGANNKWISTAGAGVFYISSDGQKTYHIFTKENSPLPNNTIIDMDINETTGEVFFATDSGLVSYNGIPTKGSENFENAMVYPNPVRPEYNGNVVITGLMDKANVKITDIEGNLVYEAISEGGTIEWDTRVFGKSKVASGVYMVFLSSDDGVETKMKKIMIIR